MYKELLEEYAQLKKVASEEKFETACSDILKEAGVFSTTGKIVGKVADKAVKFGFKHPMAAFATMTAAPILGAGINKMKQQAVQPAENPSNIEGADANPIPFRKKNIDDPNEMKLASENEYRNDENKDRSVYKYFPAVAALASAALYGAQAYHDKSFTKPFATYREGLSEAGKKLTKLQVSKLPGGSAILNAVKKGATIARKNADEAMTWYREQNRIKTPFREWATNLSQEERKRIIHAYNTFNKAQPKKKVDWSKIKEGIKEGTKKTNKGIAQGVGFGLGSFGIHAAGDKYFEWKDDNEYRKTLRKNYANDPGNLKTMAPLVGINKAPYVPPKDRVKREMDDKRHYNDRRPREKTASAGSFAKDVLVNDFLKNIPKSVSYNAGPAAMALLLNRDIRKDWSKIKDKDKPEQLDNSNGRVVIEVPLDDLNKKSNDNAAGIDKEAIDKGKLINSAKEMLKDNTRSAAKGIAYALPLALITKYTGRNIKSHFEKVDHDKRDLGPVPEGKARIIIETPKPGNSSADDFFADRSASEHVRNLYKLASNSISDQEKDVKKSLKNIADPNEKQKDEQNAQEKLIGLQLVQGVKKKQKMNH